MNSTCMLLLKLYPHFIILKKKFNIVITKIIKSRDSQAFDFAWIGSSIETGIS